MESLSWTEWELPVGVTAWKNRQYIYNGQKLHKIRILNKTYIDQST